METARGSWASAQPRLLRNCDGWWTSSTLVGSLNIFWRSCCWVTVAFGAHSRDFRDILFWAATSWVPSCHSTRRPSGVSSRLFSWDPPSSPGLAPCQSSRSNTGSTGCWRVTELSRSLWPWRSASATSWGRRRPRLTWLGNGRRWSAECSRCSGPVDSSWALCHFKIIEAACIITDTLTRLVETIRLQCAEYISDNIAAMEFRHSLSSVFPRFRALCEDPAHWVMKFKTANRKITRLPRHTASLVSWRSLACRARLVNKPRTLAVAASAHHHRVPSCDNSVTCPRVICPTVSCASLGAWQRRTVLSSPTGRNRRTLLNVPHSCMCLFPVGRGTWTTATCERTRRRVHQRCSPGRIARTRFEATPPDGVLTRVLSRLLLEEDARERCAVEPGTTLLPKATLPQRRARKDDAARTRLWKAGVSLVKKKTEAIKRTVFTRVKLARLTSAGSPALSKLTSWAIYIRHNDNTKACRPRQQDTGLWTTTIVLFLFLFVFGSLSEYPLWRLSNENSKFQNQNESKMKQVCGLRCFWRFRSPACFFFFW